jgi:DNA modification methylase
MNAKQKPQRKQNNPRQISRDEFAALQRDLAEYGDLAGIVHNERTGNLVGGNQRASAMDILSAGELVIEAEYDPPTRTGTTAEGWYIWQGERYVYRRVAWDAPREDAACVIANLRGGTWDWDVLASWDFGSLQEWGFDTATLDAWNANAHNLSLLLEAEAAPEPVTDPGADVDRAEELREKWDVRLGDLWELGAHRVICGDCTDAAVVERVMGGERARLVVTDPPYGVSYADKNGFLNSIDKGNRNQTAIENDHQTKEQTQALWKAAFEQTGAAMDKGAVIYCFMPQGGDQMMMMMMMMGAGIEPRHELIWLKNNHVLGRVDYAYKHEPILYAWKEGGHKFYGDFQTSILEFPKPQKSELHPTMKPVELIEKLVRNSSVISDCVLDPFLGSGTTLMACENLGRRCRGIEISPAYVAVTLERWAQATGKTPVRVETGDG